MSDVKPLDWTALVVEARRRRAAEKLSQVAHANLAGVSRTTIRAFDNFETTITLDKAMAILRVVGLVGDQQKSDEASFVADCLVRWKELTAKLHPRDEARLRHGYYYVSYTLKGDLSQKIKTSPERWLKLLVELPNRTGWPPFHIFDKKALQPTMGESGLECWLGSPIARKDIILDFPSLMDFWVVSTAGQLFSLRGFEEDDGEKFSPGTFLDVGLPVWRTAEVVEHAQYLITSLRNEKLGEVESVQFNVLWTGLSGRVLADWSDPTRQVARAGQYRCRVDEAKTQIVSVAADLAEPERKKLELVKLLKPLYLAFGFEDEKQILASIQERETRLKHHDNTNW